jgi:hypothetical protein
MSTLKLKRPLAKVIRDMPISGAAVGARRWRKAQRAKLMARLPFGPEGGRRWMWWDFEPIG